MKNMRRSDCLKGEFSELLDESTEDFNNVRLNLQRSSVELGPVNKPSNRETTDHVHAEGMYALWFVQCLPYYDLVNVNTDIE